MRAVVIDDFGATPRVADVAEPAPAVDEVLVRVAASSVNGFDVSVAAGRLKGAMEHRFPVVPGSDFAGTVEACGAEASRFSPGDRVFGVVMKSYLGEGSFAELVATSEGHGIAALPAALDFATAGSLALAGSAALAVIEGASLEGGETVLVSGATGGVGAIAVQYARAAGATVIATARPGREASFVEDLGAAYVADYTGDLAAEVRAAAPVGVRVIFHLAGDPDQLAGLLALDGRIVSTLGFGSDRHRSATAVRSNPTAETLARLASDVLAGHLRVPLERTYSLDEVPAALADFAAGSLGKLAVRVGG